MKKLTLLVVCLLVLALCAACGKSDASAPNRKKGWNIAKKSDREFTDVVQIKLTECDPDANQVTYEMHNPSKQHYMFGPDADFKLEILQEGTWHKMHHEPGWDVVAAGDVLNPGETKTYSTSYATSVIGELAPGTYRFIKEIQAEDSPQKILFICCEFVIA